jgi:hypothetical protein
MASMKATVAFGGNFVFHKIPYSGVSTTFDVDQSAVVATCVSPASGPSASLGTASSGIITVTLAAGGADTSGSVIIVTAHGKSIASSKP